MNSDRDLPKISIVVPCFNEEDSIPLFMEQILLVNPNIPNVKFEYIFVDDGSTDKTLQIFTPLIGKQQ